MGSHEGVMSIKPPSFNGSNLIFWKVPTKAYLLNFGAKLWAFLKGCEQEFREEKDTFVDSLEDNNLREENTQLKVSLEDYLE